jgi:hypothetical protein
MNLDNGDAELVFVTHQALEGHMRQALAQIRRLDVTRRILTLLRVEE